MQEKVALTRQAEAAARFDVEIASVASVVPQHKVSQVMVAETAKRFFPHLTGIASVFANTGIESRYVCEPPEWYYEARGWEERTASFQRNALALLEEATLKAVAAADIELADIGAIVTNTITGLAIPSLEARLVNRLPFSRHVERLPIFGLGCGGGVGGLARATRIAETMPGGHVLFLTVDLCSLCARGNDMSVGNSSPSRYSATARPRSCCATRAAATGSAGRGARSWRSASIAGPTPSTSWVGTSRTTASASC